MKSRNKFLLAASIATFIFTFVTGCYYDQVIPEKPIGDVSYSRDMQPFFNAKCVRCHNGSVPKLILLPNVSYDELISGGYVNTADPPNSLLYIKIAPGGSMEQHATSSETAVTLKWIEQGALDN